MATAEILEGMVDTQRRLPRAIVPKDKYLISFVPGRVVPPLNYERLRIPSTSSPPPTPGAHTGTSPVDPRQPA